MDYQKENSKIIDKWCSEGWKYGQLISHEAYQRALEGNWNVCLTPTKFVPHEWFGDLKGKKLLGLASGGGQQIPIFNALGAQCTVLDYSSKQCESEHMVAQRENYHVEIIQADMTQKLPFPDETFDIIFHPVSNSYIEKVEPVFQECYRVLKKNGIFLGGYDIGIDYAFDNRKGKIRHPLPFNPLADPKLYKECVKNNLGIQFSHTIEEQIGGQLRAGFQLTHLYEDTDGEGLLHEYNIPSYIATRCIKI
ncbi:MAG: class I SAM-dependent methyltransferase [Clostridia bacterium]